MRAVGLLFVTLSAAMAIVLKRDTDGGYINIGVVVDIRYNPFVMKNLRDLFSSSSRLLHEATYGYVYFKSVIFMVRPDKMNKNLPVVPRSFLKGAPFEVTSEGDFSNAGISKGLGLCGKGGGTIRLPLLFVNRATRFAKSSAAKVIHNWAMFRYGVQSEHSNKIWDLQVYNNWCKSENKPKAVPFIKCGKKLNVYASCKGCPSNNCHFVRSFERGNKRNASLMYEPYVEGMNAFCTEEDHVKGVSNDQNELCEGKSTWEVILEHDDMRTTNRSKTRYVDPVFEEVQIGEPSFGTYSIFVLDLSDSMSDFDRIDALKDAFRSTVSYDLTDKDTFGVVTFSTNATRAVEMKKFSSIRVPELRSTADSLKTDFLTCIGCALRTALKMLEEKNRVAGSLIVFLTDGEENTGPPSLADVLPSLIESNVVVDTMALGPTAENRLEELSALTGGTSYFFDDLQGEGGEGMNIAFVHSLASQKDDIYRIITVLDTKTNAKSNETLKFKIQDTDGLKTVVRLVSTNVSKNFSYVLTCPDGRRCLAPHCTSKSEVGRLSKSTLITVSRIAQPGLWTLNVIQPSGNAENIIVRVTTFQSNAAEDSIRAQTKAHSIVKDRYFITVTVKKGKSNILGAKVKVRITGAKQTHKIELDALDEGNGFDHLANDGTYTTNNIFGLKTGRYAVRADVYDLSGITFSGRDNSRRSLRQTSHTLDDNVPDLVSYGGSFKLDRDINQKDVEPQRVRNLRILRHTLFSNGSLELHVSWTSMGAYGTSETASRTELRISEDYEMLVTNFSNAKLIWNCEVIQGVLDPLPPFKNQTVGLLLSSKKVSWLATSPVFYLRHRSFNKEGTASKLSNTVTLYLEDIPKDIPKDILKDIPKDIPKNCNETCEDSDDLGWVYLILVGTSLGILTIAAILIAAYFVSHRKTNEETATK